MRKDRTFDNSKHVRVVGRFRLALGNVGNANARPGAVTPTYVRATVLAERSQRSQSNDLKWQVEISGDPTPRWRIPERCLIRNAPKSQMVIPPYEESPFRRMRTRALAGLP